MRLSFVLAATALLYASAALGQTTSNSTASANSNSQSGASIVNNAPGTITTRGYNEQTASAFAPGLTAAGINSCAGSNSAGVGGTGFNFGIGGTYEMDECTSRANAAALAGLGQNLAALESLCQSPRMKAALNASGTVCPSQRAEYIAAQQRANESGQFYVANELVGTEPPPPVVRVARPSRERVRADRRASRRAAIDTQASNSGGSLSDSSSSVAGQAVATGRVR